MNEQQQKIISRAIGRLELCGCGANAAYEIVLFLLERADLMSTGDYPPSFCDPAEDASARWVEFGAKVLDAAELLEYGCCITGAWLTETGTLMLAFLREFGTNDDKWPEWYSAC